MKEDKDRTMKTKRTRSRNRVMHFCAKSPGQKLGKARLSGLAVIRAIGGSTSTVSE